MQKQLTNGERGSPPCDHRIEAWLAEWPAMRSQARELLDAYRLRQPEYDPHWMEWVLGEMDDAVTNLAHRTAWMRRHLAEAIMDE